MAPNLANGWMEVWVRGTAAITVVSAEHTTATPMWRTASEVRALRSSPGGWHRWKRMGGGIRSCDRV